MNSVRELLPVFHYRNWLVETDDNNDADENDADDDNDDNESLQSDYLARSIAVAISSWQGCNASSSVGRLHRSPGSDDRHVIQWETGIDASQEHTHLSLDAFINQELVPTSSEQVNNDMITFLRIMHGPDEPWNPLACSTIPLVNTPAAVIYNTLYYVGSKLGAPRIYYTAPSEMVTTEAFHSATSRLEAYRNAVLGTMSV
jgi:hypothetical protein